MCLCHTMCSAHRNMHLRRHGAGGSRGARRDRRAALQDLNAYIGVHEDTAWAQTPADFHKFVRLFAARGLDDRMNGHFQQSVRVTDYQTFRYEYYLQLETLSEWLPCLAEARAPSSHTATDPCCQSLSSAGTHTVTPCSLACRLRSRSQRLPMVPTHCRASPSTRGSGACGRAMRSRACSSPCRTQARQCRRFTTASAGSRRAACRAPRTTGRASHSCLVHAPQMRLPCAAGPGVVCCSSMRTACTAHGALRGSRYVCHREACAAGDARGRGPRDAARRRRARGRDDQEERLPRHGLRGRLAHVLHAGASPPPPRAPPSLSNHRRLVH
jgi:hypothetical protein